MIDGKPPAPAEAENFIANAGQADRTRTSAHASPKDDEYPFNSFKMKQGMIDSGSQMFSQERYGTAVRFSIIRALREMEDEQILELVEAVNGEKKAGLSAGKFDIAEFKRWLATYEEEGKPEKGLLTEPGEKTFLDPPPPGSDQSAASVISQTPWNKSNNGV